MRQLIANSRPFSSVSGDALGFLLDAALNDNSGESVVAATPLLRTDFASSQQLVLVR